MGCCTVDTQTDVLAVDPVKVPETKDSEHACKSCKGAGRPVTRKTVLLMLKPQCFDQVGDSEYRFCASLECRVVYFAEDSETRFTTDDVRGRVGLKEREDPIPLCYCFGFDERDVRDEITVTGRCSIPQRVATLIRKGMCACVERNPSGKCCLGDLNRAVKNLMSEMVENTGAGVTTIKV